MNLINAVQSGRKGSTLIEILKCLDPGSQGSDTLSTLGLNSTFYSSQST